MATKFIKISDSLYLSQQEVEREQKSEVVEFKSTHYIFIADCSGSMYSEIRKVRENIKSKIRLLKSGDTVSIARFSGEGDYQFFIKGFKVESQDYKGIDSLLDKYLVSSGTTCFSEVLFDTKNVIDDLKLFGDRFALFFMTDGYPVVNNYSKEVKNIFSAIERINGELTSAVVVGYSDYYNKELLSKISESLDGCLMHSEDINSFELILDNFIKQQEEMDDRIPVILENTSDLDMYFSINGKSVISYSPKDGRIRFSPTKLKKDYLYTVTTSAPVGVEITGSELDEHFTKACYAASCIFSQKTRTGDSLSILGFIGDVYFIDKITNAFTNKEYGDVENNLNEAIYDQRERFIKGQNRSYLPKEDAFCLIDAIEILTEDSNAYFYPRHEAFSYKRRGAKADVDPDAPKFVESDLVKCVFKDLTWNETRPNLSILARIDGHVEFKNDDYKKFGLQDKFKTFTWRNYTIVSDGILNVKNLPISCSEESFTRLQDKGIISNGEVYEDGKIFVARLDAVPIMNRAMSKSLTSAESLCRDYYEQKRLEASMKTLKYFYSLEFEKDDELLSAYNKIYGEEAVEYLKEHSISSNGFSPKSKQGEATDYYIAKEFSIKLAGTSSIPKISDVIEKMKSGKSLTLSFQMVADAITDYEKHNPSEMSPEERKKLLDFKKTETQNKLKSTKKKIQVAKFAILLGKQWFKEFTSREENTIDVDGNKFTIEVKDKQVNY